MSSLHETEGQLCLTPKRRSSFLKHTGKYGTNFTWTWNEFKFIFHKILHFTIYNFFLQNFTFYILQLFYKILYFTFYKIRFYNLQNLILHGRIIQHVTCGGIFFM